MLQNLCKLIFWYNFGMIFAQSCKVTTALYLCQFVRFPADKKQSKLPKRPVAARVSLKKQQNQARIRENIEEFEKMLCEDVAADSQRDL